MPIINYIYLATILIAFLTSLICFRLDLSIHFKVFSLLLALTFIVEIGSVIIGRVLHHKNNFWIYNAFTLPEFWIYGYFYHKAITVRVLRKIVFLFLLIFPIFWFITVFFIFGFNVWNSYVLIVGSFFSVVLALMYYYQMVTAREFRSIRDLPEFWIATGMLIFYLGALPYFGTLNFLISYSRSAATRLLTILKILDILMYSLFSYGFLCLIITSKRSRSS
jgi:hypothetical protein